MREYVLEKVLKHWYKRKPRQIVALCDLFGMAYHELANKSIIVNVPANLSTRRGKKFKAIKYVHYVIEKKNYFNVHYLFIHNIS